MAGWLIIWSFLYWQNETEQVDMDIWWFKVMVGFSCRVEMHPVCGGESLESDETVFECLSPPLSEWRGSVIKEFVDPPSPSLSSPLLLHLPSVSFLICVADRCMDGCIYAHRPRPQKCGQKAHPHISVLSENVNVKLAEVIFWLCCLAEQQYHLHLFLSIYIK